MTLLLKNFLLCDGGTETARYGSVMVEGGKIASIGAPEWAPPAAETVDGRGKAALLPGFVNAHTHAAMSLLRGIGEEAPLMEWLKEKIWPAEAKLKGEHVSWGTKLALLEMAANGITAFGDMYFFMDSVVEASLEMGMKCAVSRGIVGPEQVKLDEGLQLAETWKGREEFVTVQLAPHAPYTVPLSFLKEIVAAAKDRNLGIHFHFLEAEWETGYLRDEMKMTPAEYLAASGMPEVRQAVLAHCVWLDPAVLDEVDFSRMTIAHNPKSNQKLGSGMMDLPGMMEKTRKIALGTDGAASNNRLDVWGEMRSAALVSKGISKDPTRRSRQGCSADGHLRGGGSPRVREEGDDPGGLGRRLRDGGPGQAGVRGDRRGKRGSFLRVRRKLRRCDGNHGRREMAVPGRELSRCGR